MTVSWKPILGACALAVCLSGCSGDDNNDVVISNPSPSPAANTNLRGVVQSGGTTAPRPLVGAQVTLFEAGAGAPRSLGTAVTDSAGQFALTTPRTTTDGIFYATANVGPGVTLTTIAGSTLPPTLTINELTTVGASYSMAQFYTAGGISGVPQSLRIAAGMNDNLVVATTGTSSSVLQTSPNGDETNSLRSTRALANALASSLQQPSQFLQLTSATDTAQGLANLARNPARNVNALYTLSKTTEPYQPSLERVPDAWTVCVKVNDSGNLNQLFSGPGNIAFDEFGNLWITNNSYQQTTTSGNFAIALKPNGKPQPFSPLLGGGLLGGGFGVDVDSRGNIWFGNFGWGGVNPGPTSTGSLSLFAPDGRPLSGPQGIQGGVNRAQGLTIDSQNNLWVASFGNDQLVVLPNLDPTRPITFQGATGSGPFEPSLNPDGSLWMSNSGGLDGQKGSSVGHYTLVGGSTLRQDFLVNVGKANKSIVADPRGNGWLCSQSDSTIYGLRPDGTQFGAFTGGGIDGPWGICLDGDENLWVADFGPLKPGSDFTNGRISQIVGSNPATRPAGLNVGDPLSPATGYTLPSAGAQVRLANGQPLYGPGGPPSFAPLMRLTAVQIDQAGNVWAVNNWKPSFDVDVTSNPGGDGLVIFVGLAKPPKR